MNIRKLTLSALMAALALALSYAERLIPLELIVPLPGVKLGLANIVTMFALYCFDFPTAAVILLVRCLLGSTFGGGMTGLVFSLAGGFLALGAMALFKRLRSLSVYGVSVIGAAAHSTGQILAAMAVLGSLYTAAYLPFLIAVSVVTGLITGAVTWGLLRVLPKALGLDAGEM